jgi:DNA (cytosine-5)-methyltransferase 1
MYPTPTQDSASERTKKYSQGGMPLPMAVKMFPTPTASDIEGGAAKDVQIQNGHFFRENKKGERWGVKLRDAIEMYPTPTTRDYKDSTLSSSYQNRNSDSLPIKMMKEGKPGGKLNPNFVEFLMGYPMNWTKIDPTE